MIMEKKRSLIVREKGVGSVDLVITGDGREAVLQSSSYADSKAAAGLLQEYTLLNKIKDPYIIEYLDIWLEKEAEICILCEYFQNGTLNDLIAKVAAQEPLNYLHEKDIVNWLFCIAHGLKCIHDMGMAHKDIHVSNIYLTNSREVKLGCFGLAKTVLVPPGESVDKFDMFCLGTVLYSLCTLKLTAWEYPQDKNFDLMILKKSLEDTKYSKELIDLVITLLSWTTMPIPSAQDILALPWVESANKNAIFDCTQLLELQKFIKLHSAANDYQMNLLITNGINDANLKVNNQLTQLYVVHKTVELWKQNEQKTALLEQNSTIHTKLSAPKNNYNLSAMVSQFRNNPEISAQVLAASGIFQTSSSNTKDFNINLIIACVYRFMSHPIDQIEFLSLSRHLLDLLHKQPKNNSIASGALVDLFYQYGIVIGSREYFLYVLNDIIMEILSSEDLVLISDTEKQKAFFGQLKKDTLAAKQDLDYYVSRFVSAILVHLESVPTGIRLLAKQMSIPERRVLVFKTLFWRFLLQPELTCAFSRVAVSSTAKANLNEIIPELYAHMHNPIFDKYWEDLVNVSDLSQGSSIAPLNTVFLKEDVKRLIEFCQSDLWPAMLKVNIKEAEITSLPDQKVIWVEYSPEVIRDKREPNPALSEEAQSVKSTKKRLKFMLNTISEIGAVSLTKSPIQVLQEQKAANWNVAHPSSIVNGLQLLIDAMLALPPEYQANNFSKFFSEVKEDIKEEQLNNITFLNQRSYSYNKLLYSCTNLENMTSLNYDYLSFLRLKSLATPKSSPLEHLLNQFETSMKTKEKRTHCACVFMEEIVCPQCKNKQKEYVTLMKKCLELVSRMKCSAEEMKYMMIRIERTVMDTNFERLHTVLEEDFALRNKLTIAKLTVADFEINPRLLQGAPWSNAQDELHKITKFSAACDKIKCITGYVTTLVKNLSLDLSEVGADDLLPVRAFVLYSVLSASIGSFHSRGQLTDPYAQFQFITLYGTLTPDERGLLQTTIKIDLTVIHHLLEQKILKKQGLFVNKKSVLSLLDTQSFRGKK
eukprot:Phypoly_transcript_01689.p1 GENE.Phypoly_transcript_01689~~Phypoly_transcript_01689.p1  ORF type:complete len:1043 (+),score=126.98 Phypoly_transcript_01689:67-3195(+)